MLDAVSLFGESKFLCVTYDHVLWRPVRCNHIRPLAVAGGLPRCLLLVLTSRNGIWARNPRFTACKRVCRGRLKNAGCMNLAQFVCA